MNLNRVTLIGHVTYGPCVHTLASGEREVRIVLATTHVWRDSVSKEAGELTEFHAVLAVGKLGEVVAQYVKQGSRVYIEGRLQSHQPPAAAHVTEVIASNMILLGHRTRPTNEQEGA